MRVEGNYSASSLSSVVAQTGTRTWIGVRKESQDNKGAGVKKNIDAIIVEQAIWAQDQVDRNPFSQVDISFMIHDGKVARIKRGIAVQVKPDYSVDPEDPGLTMQEGLAS